MLGFNDFCNEIKEELPAYLKEHDIEEIHIAKVTKNNGKEYTGISVREAGETIAPNIYLDSYYGSYLEGTAFEDILMQIAADHNYARENVPDFSMENLYDKEKLFVRLVNYDRNENMLKDVPHQRYLDMAVTVHMLVKRDDDGIASCQVTNDMLGKFGMAEDELVKSALENTQKLFPAKINSLFGQMEEMTGEDLSSMRQPGMPEVYVLTNDCGTNGAACMFYDDVMKKAAALINGNFSILPSSIHEVLLVPDTLGMSQKELAGMVWDVNRTAVSEKEFLSDSVYQYDREKNEISIAYSDKEASQVFSLDR